MPQRFTAISRSTPPPKNKPKQSQSSNAMRDTQHAIRKPNPNEPNFKIGKKDISTATTTSYHNELRTMNNERYSKRTQSNPIPPPPPERYCLYARIEIFFIFLANN